jgi:DNA-binding transcriptional LysR family regulator
MRGLNLDHLRSFVDVVELGSFSAAAARLNLTQPAVSQQIRLLESRVGTRLIERTGRRAMPTAAGAELLAHARRIEAMANDALEAMRRHAAGVTGRVRLGTGATACIYLLPAILGRLRQRFPALDIVVSTANSAVVLEALEQNRIDLGLVTLPAPGRMFQVTPLVRDEIVAVAATGDDRLPARVTPASLMRVPVVLYEPGANTRRVIDDWFGKAGLTLKPVLELGSVEAIKQLVAAGLGCGLLPRMAVARKEARAGLAVRPLAPRLQRDLGLVMRRDKPLGRGLREVVKALGRTAD